MIKVKTEDPKIGPLSKSSAAIATAAAARTLNSEAIELTTPTRNFGSLKRTMIKYWEKRIDTKATAAGARTTGAYVRQQPMILHA